MNPSQFKMGDFYLGQPTVEGVVKDTPRGGIMDMIPGINTVANVFGRNRGLPESSEAIEELWQMQSKEVQTYLIFSNL